jgi:NDP-sugar pyrophosphorylase family protein
MQAVIMAGGKGTRLRPLTYAIPKPLLPIGEKPILELILKRLKRSGIRDVIIATGYRSELIETYFGNGKKWGIRIGYARENKPLGTAGILRRLRRRLHGDFLVMNGDVLTELNFHKMLLAHRKTGADVTVGVRALETEIPYGVLECRGDDISTITEKPRIRSLISAGIYLIRPAMSGLIPGSGRYDMPQLITKAIAEGRRVSKYEIREYWMDIGHLDDFQKAVDDMQHHRVKP